MNKQNQQVWARVLSCLTDRIKPELIGNWLADLELTACNSSGVQLIAPNAVHAQLVKDHYLDHISEGFFETLGYKPEVKVITRSQVGKLPDNSEPAVSANNSYNPVFSLDTYIEGKPNRLALAACRAIVDQPGDLYNPLFIYGPSGIGKTHLLQGLCRELEVQGRLLYLTAGEFSIRIAAGEKDATAFRKSLRSADILAIDDVQTLAGREDSQEELFHAFNELYNRNGQLLFTADVAPRDLENLPERLRSRFTWGLAVEIEAPLYENRLEILISKAKTRGVDVPREILEKLAKTRTSSVRELEGMLASLAASHDSSMDFSKLSGTGGFSDTSGAGAAAKDVHISSENIQRVVSATYGLRPSDLLGDSRTRSVALARHVAIYLAKKLTDLPVQEIGGHFGGRDHSTVNYAVGKITSLIEKDASMERMIQKLTRQLRSSKRVN